MLKGKFVGSYKNREELQTEEKLSDIIKLAVLEAQKVKNTLLKPSNKKHQSTSDHQRRQHRKGLLVQTGKIH